MPNMNNEMTQRPANYTQRDKSRAQLAKVLPCIGQMRADELQAVNLNYDAVQAVMAETVQPSMHGASENVSLTGMHVFARKGVNRFFDILAPIDSFSTTYSEDYVVAGHPGVLPKLEIPIYDDQGGAEVDNFNSFATREDSGTVTSAEVELHKVDKVIKIYGRDIQQGVNLEARFEAALSCIAREVQGVVFDLAKVGTAQGDDESKKVTALQIPAIGNGDGEFNFAYANQVLSESIQPRVHGLLVDSAHYGALKAANKDSLTAGDLDVDAVHKVQGLEKLGTGVVGLAVNKRGLGVGLAAPYMMRGAYATYEQLRRGDQNLPIACVTWYDPNENCIKVWFGVYVGVAVTDAAAVKPLVVQG